MGKVTDHGWSSSSDEIPEPTSILLVNNLRKNSEQSITHLRRPAGAAVGHQPAVAWLYAHRRSV
jgi:hypothetical protein